VLRRIKGTALPHPNDLETRDDAVLLSQLSDEAVRVTLTASGTADDVLGGSTGHLALLVELSDGDLDGSVVRGTNEAVGGGARGKWSEQEET
jgi:hypothetical protein